MEYYSWKNVGICNHILRPHTLTLEVHDARFELTICRRHAVYCDKPDKAGFNLEIDNGRKSNNRLQIPTIDLR